MLNVIKGLPWPNLIPAEILVELAKIGLRYLVAPAMSITVGATLANKK
jgi:hypothetical protein